MYQAFPGSDYYGDSVAMRFSPFRQSRVPSAADVQVGLGALFVPLLPLLGLDSVGRIAVASTDSTEFLDTRRFKVSGVTGLLL